MLPSATVAGHRGACGVGVEAAGCSDFWNLLPMMASVCADACSALGPPTEKRCAGTWQRGWSSRDEGHSSCGGCAIVARMGLQLPGLQQGQCRQPYISEAHA